MMKIGDACNKAPFLFKEKIAKRFPNENDMMQIIATVKNIPDALLILMVDENDIKVINIIPYQKSAFRIEKSQYNVIIDAFDAQIIRKVCMGYKITNTPAEYTMESLIPHSYQALYQWANCPGAPDDGFIHQYDLERWFNFIITLFENKELDKLMSGDLEQWLEEQKWNEDQVEEAILHYEHDKNFIEYYGTHNR